jgi:deoxyribodipyrimidine photo-lyase
MIAYRRLAWNFALDRAVSRARKLGRPLVVLEPLRAGYPWASDRFHRFVLDGMASHARRKLKLKVNAYVERWAPTGQGRQLRLG